MDAKGFRKLRERVGHSYRAAERHTGVSFSHQAKIERGEIDASPKVLDAFVRASVRLSEKADPRMVALVDGVVAAKDPKILIHQERLIHTGLDEVHERILASADADEIEVLAAICRLGFQRLAEIRRALQPLISVPS